MLPCYEIFCYHRVYILFILAYVELDRISEALKDFMYLLVNMDLDFP